MFDGLPGNANLAHGLCLNARQHGGRVAIDVAGRSITYAELAAFAGRLAAQFASRRDSGRVGILASRSLAACAGILGTAWSGGTYVPLHLKLPEARLASLLGQLALDAVVVDARGAALLTPSVRAALPGLVILADDAPEVAADASINLHRLGRLPGDALAAPVNVAPDDVAYIEFTSGTTGMPKGVMVPVGAVNHYLGVMQAWFGFGPDDRAAETCDITFDLSVHNMFLAWLAGASLHIMTPLHMMAPSRFIREHQITTWLSVPSIIGMMQQTRTLAPGIFPSLRLSCFCGEPLPLAGALAWAEAAPNSIVENIYGPTEATIACLRQPVGATPVVTKKRQIIAIGHAYPGMKASILSESLTPLPAGTPGEIALSGKQLALGYFNQPELTAQRFPSIDGERWYLTGDLGVQDEQGVFHHLGRIDNQVKVLGNRVELEEIDMHLREAAGTQLAAAVAWPMRDGSASGIVGFVSGATAEPDAMQAALRRSLPGYMLPNAIREIGEMPLNSNGKVDRKALLARLEAERT
jgi:amino acid adenylation domain-containing protein